MIITLAITLLGGVTVELPANAEVNGASLTLGDVAMVTGADELENDRVRDLDLGYAPAPGYSRLLHRDRIKERVKSRLPGVVVSFSGEGACRVTPTIQIVAGAELEAEARRAVVARFVSDDLELTRTGRLVDLQVPKGEGETELRATVRNTDVRAGTWNVPVEIVIDGDVYRTVWTTWRVETWETRRVLARNVSRGETLEPSLFEVRRVKIGTGLGGDALSTSALAQAVAVRDLQAGSVVTARDVQRLKVLSRGAMVTVEVKSGAITARAMGTALEDGRVGDRIRVAMNTDGRELRAVVVGRELVQVRLQGSRTK